MQQLPRSIVENAAILLGRVAWVWPEGLAPHLQQFLGVWCRALRSIRDEGNEKEHAFLGLFRLLRANPQVLRRADDSPVHYQAPVSLACAP